MALLPPAPQDIHARQGVEGAAVCAFVLVGKNTMLLRRLCFDVAQGTALEVQLVPPESSATDA